MRQSRLRDRTRQPVLLHAAGVALALVALLTPIDAVAIDAASVVGVEPDDTHAASASLRGLDHTLSSMSPSDRLTTLHEFAAMAIEAGTLDVFRDVVTRHHDTNWSELDDDQTMLSLLDWLPDNASYLDTRVSVATLLHARQVIDDEQQVRLWKNLRARSERVGHANLTSRLALGMAASGHLGLAFETVGRAPFTESERLDVLIKLAEGHTLPSNDDALDAIAEELSMLGSSPNSTQTQAIAVLTTLCDLGKWDLANGLVAQQSTSQRKAALEFATLARPTCSSRHQASSSGS